MPPFCVTSHGICTCPRHHQTFWATTIFLRRAPCAVSNHTLYTLQHAGQILDQVSEWVSDTQLCNICLHVKVYISMMCVHRPVIILDQHGFLPRRLWSRRLQEVCLRPWDGCLWGDNQHVRLLSDFNAYSATQCTMVYFDRFRSGISRNRTWTTQHCRSCYGLGPATKFHLPINRSHFVSRRSPRLSDGCQAVNNTTATTSSYIVSWTQVGALLRERSRPT